MTGDFLWGYKLENRKHTTSVESGPWEVAETNTDVVDAVC